MKHQLQIAFNIDNIDDPKLETMANIIRNVAYKVQIGVLGGFVNDSFGKEIGTYAIVSCEKGNYPGLKEG